MSINLSFIDFVVPIATIRSKYIGGFEKCLFDHRKSLGGSVYFDLNLFHTGTMDPDDADRLIDKWSAFGFESTDFCVMESLLPHANNQCDWLIIDQDERTAHYAGTKPGAIAGRRLFYERRKTTEAKSKFKLDCRRMRWTAFLIYRLRNVNPALVARLKLWLIRQQMWEPLPKQPQS